jgi:formylglycine-generating enzyme required for sulfatase activity
MGSNDGGSNEQPVHTVTLDAFYMDLYEVTNGMNEQCVAAGTCNPPQATSSLTRSSYYGDTSYDNYPVIRVDWNQAAGYCAWAGGRLPTEAEWEYAARGWLQGATYPWGEWIDCSLANYNYCCVGDTSEVGSYGANGYGLYDMAGNVWEWVADWYDSSYYSNSPADNPSGPSSGDARALRGGTWDNNGNFLRVSVRFWYSPDLWYYNLGFRCALSP